MREEEVDEEEYSCGSWKVCIPLWEEKDMGEEAERSAGRPRATAAALNRRTNILAI